MLRKTYPIILSLIFVALVIAGCRVRSAGEDKDPTPRSNVAINYNLQPNMTPGGLDALSPTPSPTLTILSPTPTDGASPTPSESPTPSATVTFSDFLTPGSGGLMFTETPTMELPPSMTSTATSTVFVPPTLTPTATATNTVTATPTLTATNTNQPTLTPSASPTPSPSPTITPSPTPTSRFTLTFTPFPPPTITPLGVSSNGGIGGGSNAIANTPTPSPMVVAQSGPTQNPQQQTATAYILQAQLTAQAQQGTFFPTATPDLSGSGGQFIPTTTPTIALYPDCEEFIDPGETLSQIARTYAMDIAVIAAANQITNYDFIKAGDYITIPGCGRIPTPTPTPTAFTGDGSGGQAGPPAELDNSLGPVTYTVVAGDTLYKLSIQFNVTLAQLWSANPMVTDINLLSIGQTLTIPKRTIFDTPTPTPTITG